MRPIDQAISKASPENPVSIPTMPSIPSVSPTINTAIPAQCCCHRLLGAGEWSLPLRRHADDLIRLYFSRVHRMYPILHKPTFVKQYRQLWEPAGESPKPSPTNAQPPNQSSCSGLCKQKSLDKTFPAMVNAVFALASLFGSSTAKQNSARAGSFFAMAQQVDLLDIIDDEVGIELVQLLLLMGFYLQSTERFSKCWNITGLAIRMAQNMGLQLNPHEARRKGLLTSCPTQLESEMRVRVWYGCVLLDREISMSFGRPLMITSSGGERLRLPEAIDDEYLSVEPGGKRNLQPGNCPSLLESYVQTINLYDILGQVLDREEAKESPTSRTDSNLDTQSLLHLDTMIMEWRDSLPSHLQYEPSESTSDDAERQEAASERPGKRSPPPPADFLAQAKRLHARFLHVRVLILRPALEHLFEKQRHVQPPTSNIMTNQMPRPRVARVQDIMLSSIAAQCVLSANSLVRCLDKHIRSQSLVAWWYNVGCKIPRSTQTTQPGQVSDKHDKQTYTQSEAPSSWANFAPSMTRPC